MDIDLDFSDDKIESFLSTKLEEIRLKNESLETVLNQHKHALQFPPGDSLINEISFKVTESDSWKKIFNNKYTIGYVVVTPSEKDYQDIRVFLTWNSEETLCYKVETFSVIPASEEVCKETTNCNFVIDTVQKQCDTFRGETYLVVIFNVPQYLYKLEYQISGTFVCKVEGVDFKTLLPIATISTKDSTTSSYWISQNPLHNIFSMITCSNQTDLVMILPEEWTAPLISTFEIHCALTHIKVSLSCKSYFVACDVSKLLNNTLIVVHSDHSSRNTFFLKVHATSNDQIYALCHHLGSCLPNITFFPLSYYESHLCKNALFSAELLGEFRRSMGQELEFTFKFAQYFSGGNSNKHSNNFRSTLSTMESNTDKLFLKVSNMKY